MGKIEFRFTVKLKRNDLPSALSLQGPIFLASVDGLEKGLTIAVSKSRGTLHLWFDNIIVEKQVCEAGVCVHDIDINPSSYVYWDPADVEKAAFDPFAAAMVRFRLEEDRQEDSAEEYAIEYPFQRSRPLEYTDVSLAGSLQGYLEYQYEVPEETLTAIVEGDVSSQVTFDFCREIVGGIIHPYASRLLDLLHTHYGQFWIQDLRPLPRALNMNDEWAKHGLRDYCENVLDLHYRTQANPDWSPFYRGTLHPWSVWEGKYRGDFRFKQYLGAQDWVDIQRFVQGGQNVVSAGKKTSRAYELLQRVELQDALIEGIIALERAIKSYVHREVPSILAESWWNKPDTSLGEKFRRLAPTVGISSEIVQKRIGSVIVRKRNDVVHGFTDISADDIDGVSTFDDIILLLEVVAKFLPKPEFRFVRPPED